MSREREEDKMIFHVKRERGGQNDISCQERKIK
jgi:hypothetical protein